MRQLLDSVSQYSRKHRRRYLVDLPLLSGGTTSCDLTRSIGHAITFKCTKKGLQFEVFHLNRGQLLLSCLLHAKLADL